MKTINKLGLLLLSALTLAACNDDDYKAGAWDAADGYQNVSFVRTSLTDELDPTDPTSTTVTLKRKVTKGAIDVKPEVVRNDGDVFTVTDFHFADGDSLATATISFPDAEIGTSYSLQLTITDKDLVSSYSDKVLFNYNVTRVKWNLLGEATFIDSYMGGLFQNVSSCQGKCNVYQRDDKPNYYRMQDPLGNCYFTYNGTPYPYSAFLDEDLDAENMSSWFNFHVLEQGEPYAGVEEVQGEDLVAYDDYCTGLIYSADYGDVWYMHPSNMNSYYEDESGWEGCHVVSWQEIDDAKNPGEKVKIPAEIRLGAFVYVDKAKGGWDKSGDELLTIYFPGFKPAHVADLSEDFEWEEVFTGEYISEQLGTKGSASLYKGTCVNTTDDCDKTFAAQYGTAYTVAAPYAEDYNLIFTVKDGEIMIPEDYEFQATGLQALNQDVYAKINMGKSTFTEKLITLNITFTNEDGSTVFGTADEQLSNITYSTVGTADWTYSILYQDENGNPVVDEGLTLQQRDDDDSQYQILHALGDVTIKFSIDEDNIVRIPQQLTGEDYQAGVPFYVGDVPSVWGESYREKFPSVYNPETKTISSYLFYNIGGGQGFTPAVETIKLNFGATPASVKKATKKHQPSVQVLRGMSKKFRASSPWSNYKKQAPQRVTRNSAPTVFLSK